MSLSPRPSVPDRDPPPNIEPTAPAWSDVAAAFRAHRAAAHERSAWHRTWLFALNFLKHPLTVGTFVQSSPALVRRLLDGVDWSLCRTVVELGPGVGTISEALLERLREDARLLLVERNADFVRELRDAMPDQRVRVIHGSAVELTALLSIEGAMPVDVVVSGIPFSTLRPALRGKVLDAVRAALRPDGQLLVYQHTGHVLPLLRRCFGRVVREIEWRNPVPMRVFRCSDPRSDQTMPPRRSA